MITSRSNVVVIPLSHDSLITSYTAICKVPLKGNVALARNFSLSKMTT